MGFNVSSGNTSVTGTVTSTESLRTAIPLAATRTTAGTTTMGTVPANKIWRIVTANLTGNATAVANNCSITAEATDLLTLIAYGTATQVTCLSVAQQWNVGCCPILTAGQTITLVSDCNAITKGNVTYYETDA